VVADKGYAGTTVADVVARAGVSRKTFYEHFAGKEDCFLAAYDAGVDRLVARLEQAEAGHEDREERVRAGVRAYLETLRDEPALARTCLLEVHAAGPRALARRAEVHRRFRDRLAELHRPHGVEPGEVTHAPEAHLLALVGGVDAVCTEWVREGRTAELPELEPTLIFLHLALFAQPPASPAPCPPAAAEPRRARVGAR
jgi:AcrR family transcriptional regulator